MESCQEYSGPLFVYTKFLFTGHLPKHNELLHMVDRGDELLFWFFCIYFMVQGLCGCFMFIEVIVNFISVVPLYRIMVLSITVC